MKKNSKKNAEPRLEQETASAESALEVSKVDFDAWYAMRTGRIPKHHHKEILKADFQARGLGQCESLEDFDKALNKYGIKLS